MLISPNLFKSSANLSISALNAVTWITKDFFVLSKTTGLNFLQIFFIFSCFVEFASILNKASSLNKISRITIVTEGTPQVIEQINLQLKKLVPVHKVADFKRGEKDILFRELALFKMLANSVVIKVSFSLVNS